MRGVAIASIVTTWMTASVAAADALTARLELTGACELEILTERTNELLGRVAIVPDGRATIRIATERGGDTLVANLDYVDDTGTTQAARTITATSCEELAESVAVVVSLVLRQQAMAPPPAPSPPPPVEPIREPIREVEPQVVPSIASESTRSLELGAAAGSTGAASFIVGGRLQRGRAATSLELGIDKPTELAIGPGAVHVAIARLDATGCARFGALAACGLVTAGLVRGRGGDGLMDGRTAVRPIAGLGARVEWRQLVSARVGLRVFCDFEQLLVSTGFLVDGMAVWTSESRQAWVGAGVFLQTP